MISTNSPMEQLSAFAIVFVCGVLTVLAFIVAVLSGRNGNL